MMRGERMDADAGGPAPIVVVVIVVGCTGRRALLRQPLPPHDDSIVELAAHYCLRLAGACRTRGLVADAEWQRPRQSCQGR
jgi:hypothetical protein